MSTATVSASRPAERAGGVWPPGATFGFDEDDEEDVAEDDELFGLIDTGLPGAGRRGVGEEAGDDAADGVGDDATVLVGASDAAPLAAAGAEGLGFRAADPFAAAGDGFGADPGDED